MLQAFLDQIPFYFDRLNAAAVADIFLVTLVIFLTLLVIRGTRAVQLLRGLLIIVALVALLTFSVDLPAFNLVFQTIFPALLVAFPVLFQPELRRALDKVGRTGQFIRFFRQNERSPMLDAIGNAGLHLSQRRHGALIAIEQQTGLQEYVDTGILLDAEPSPELFLTIFNKNTELHDGAVIVSGEKIVAAACVMPLSTSSLSDRQLGLRHRAGLGLSEVSDAIVVIVSEETGRITIAHNGRLIRRQDPTRLSDILHAFINNRRQQAETPPTVPAVEQ